MSLKKPNALSLVKPQIDEIPAVIPVSNCERHGQYQHRYQPSLTGNGFIECEKCPTCLAENSPSAERERSDRRKESEQATRKRIEAGVSKRNLGKTLKTYRAESRGQKYALSSCMAFAESVKRGDVTGSLFLTGSVGTGKTHLASAIADALVDSHRVEIIRLIDLMRRLKETFSRNCVTTEREVIAHYSNLDVLVIDEIGIQFDSDTERMFIFDVINGRYENQLPTILISNLSMDSLKPILGGRCTDRLREDGGIAIAFNWESERGK